VSVPVFALLCFAFWTILILFVVIGPYRWLRIFSGETRVSDWTADPNAGHGWYPRAMRAHMNCVENLPVFGAIVFAIETTKVSSSVIDIFAVIVIAARVVQTSIHVGFVQTDLVATLRFSFFFIQMIAMTVMIVALLTSL